MFDWALRVAGAAAALLLFSSGAPSAHAAIFGQTSPASVVRSSAWISSEAERLSGRRLTVSCAESAQSWATTLGDAGLPPSEADEYYGFSVIQAGEMRLSPYVCDGLQLGVAASTRKSNELQVAWSVDVLIHESTHLGRSTPVESLAEACARVGLPNELHRLYGIAYGSTELKRLTSLATLFRRTMGAAYQGGVCPPAGT